MLRDNKARAITVDRLIRLLEDLPPDAVIQPTNLGNLMALDGKTDAYLGYIDLGDDTYNDLGVVSGDGVEVIPEGDNWDKFP